MSQHTAPLTILQLVPEPLPTHRPDLTDLFGKFLPRLGITCRIVGHANPGGDEPAAQGYDRLDRACSGYPAAPRILREASYLLLACKRLACVRRDGVDLIQVRDMVSTGLLAWVAARLLRTRFVWWMSFPMSEDRIARAARLRERGHVWRPLLLAAKGHAERWLLYRFLLPRADHVFVQSQAMSEMLQAQGLPHSLMTPAPMCVDCSELKREALLARRPPGWEACPLLVYLGTLDAARDIGTVVRGLALLRRRCPQARLLLVGDASTVADREALQRVIESEAQQDAVSITGWLPRAQALHYLVGADVCISWYPRSPVLDVGTPTKLVECLALGVPVIANDHPDQTEVLRASGAGVVCETNAAALAEALVDVLAAPDLARDRAQRGPAWVSRERNYERLASDLAERYWQLLITDGVAATQAGPNLHRWGK